MDNKLSELSNPAWIVGQQEIDDFMRGDEALLVRGHDPESTEPALRMYSQEYVSALLVELKSSQAIANEYQQLMYHMDAGGDFYEFQRDKAGEK
ncbi:hypothetical protein JY552_04375 [Serratia marcescens]|nr:hypothetical protein [Serratia marcescens]